METVVICKLCRHFTPTNALLWIKMNNTFETVYYSRVIKLSNTSTESRHLIIYLKIHSKRQGSTTFLTDIFLYSLLLKCEFVVIYFHNGHYNILVAYLKLFLRPWPIMTSAIMIFYKDFFFINCELSWILGIKTSTFLCGFLLPSPLFWNSLYFLLGPIYFHTTRLFYSHLGTEVMD